MTDQEKPDYPESEGEVKTFGLIYCPTCDGVHFGIENAAGEMVDTASMPWEAFHEFILALIASRRIYVDAMIEGLNMEKH